MYIGSTDNLENRMRAHKEGLFPGFTKKYGVDKLVYYEEHSTIEEVATRERRLKHWMRDWKIKLIEEDNLTWKDLAEGWFG